GLAKLVPERITHVGFGGWPAPAAAGYVYMPSFTKLSKAFPNLTGLELTGSCPTKPGNLKLPKLVDLEVRFASPNSTVIGAIVGSKLPKLERLSVWLGGTANVCVDDVYPPDEWEEGKSGADRYPKTFDAADLENMDVHDVDSYETGQSIGELLEAELSPSLVHLAIKSTCLTPE